MPACMFQKERETLEQHQFKALVKINIAVFIYVTALCTLLVKRIFEPGQIRKNAVVQSFKKNLESYSGKQSQIHQQNRCFPVWWENTSLLYVLHMIQISQMTTTSSRTLGPQYSCGLRQYKHGQALLVQESQNFIIVF